MMIEKLQWRSVDAPTHPRPTPLFSPSDVSAAHYRVGDEDDYDERRRLDLIDLSGLSLDTIPDTSINLAAICKLDLSNNNLQNIPESVTARLLNTVALDVHSNQLTCLPNSIGCLSKLKLLNVSSNLLRSLPKTIQNCRRLEELNANFNKLAALPETIGFELLNLKKLSVNSNQIMFLPYSMSHLTALRVLDVRLNCLRLLPEDLESLTSLQVLNVSQNFRYLTKLPYSIGLLVSLVELDVSYNKITTLPSSIGCLKRLRKLCVEGNPLICPPMEVVEMGLHTVQLYLTGQLNGVHDSPKRKKSWFGQLKKHRTRNVSTATNGAHDDLVDSSILSCRGVEAAAASPRHQSMLSPHRLFSSPRNSFPRFS